MTTDRAAGAPDLPLDGRPLRLSLGLRRLDLDQWLVVDDRFGDDLRLKARLLETRHDDVVAHQPAGTSASTETLELVHAWMRQHHPDRVVIPQRDLHPVDAAGRLVQEDLCVLTDETGPWRLSAASVCFPSRWRLEDKIGATVAEIHGPVPGYQDQIGSVVDRSLDRLTPERPVWRLNWSLLDDPSLFQPEAVGPAAAQPPAPRDLTFRVERQTLRRLPTTGGVLFTIRTSRWPLAEVLARPGAARNLAATLRTVPEDMAAYKGWTWLLPTILTLADDAARHADSSTPPTRRLPG